MPVEMFFIDSDSECDVDLSSCGLPSEDSDAETADVLPSESDLDCGWPASMTCRQPMEFGLRSMWSMSTAASDDDLEEGETTEDSNVDHPFLNNLSSSDGLEEGEISEEEGENSEEEGEISDADEVEKHDLIRPVVEQEFHFHRFLKGQIQTATIKPTCEVVAVKKIMQANSAQRMKFETELRKVMTGRCQAIVQYHGTVTLGVGLNLVMEFHDLGGLNCLMEKVARCGTTFVPVDHVAFISQSAATGLKLLHDMGIVHRRLKPENILHNTMGEVKLTDVVQSDEPDFDCMALPVRTYASPERCLGANCSPEEDIWSLGLVLHELVTGNFPYVGNSHMQLFQMVTQMPEPRLDPALFPEPLCDFLAHCLTREIHPLDEEDVAVLDTDTEVQPWSDVGTDTAPPAAAHVLILSLSGEKVLGLSSFAQPVLVKELSDFVCGMTKLSTFDLVFDGRILHPEERISGGTLASPLGLTLVAATAPRVRATAARLLGHSFCRVGVPSQVDFAHWLQELA